MSSNHFQTRTNQAALALKAQLSQQTGKEIKPRSVPVGPNGQPAPPLPPQGSYARQAIERQQAAAAQARAAVNPQDPPPELPEQQDQGQGHQGAQGHEQQQDPNQLSPNAQRRFSELTQLLRTKDQELQQALARSKQLEESNAQTVARLQEIENRFNATLSQNLDSLDPDTRQQVLNQAAIDQSVAQIEQRIMQRVQPYVERVTTQAIAQELNAVAQKYPGFNADVHGPLIEIFRQKNPHCTIEQAFRAVAEPEELVTARSRSTAVPPIAVQNNGSSSPRYVPQPADPNRKTPEQELEEDRQRAFRLAQSTDPRDRRLAGPAMDRYIANKLKGRLPGSR